MPTLHKVVCFGDSITFGEGVDPATNWVSLLQEAYQRELSPEIQVVNSGTSGNTAYMGLNRVVSDLQEHRPDLVTLQFGMNDCNYWQTDEGIPRTQPETFVACLKEIILRARHFGAKRVVLSTNHPSLRQTRMLNGEPYEQNNVRYNVLIRDVARATSCDLFDAHEYFHKSGRDLENLLLPDPDLLHLSEDGNHLYFQGIWECLSTQKARSES